MSDTGGHFAMDYALRVNDGLHACLQPTWFYKHEIYDLPGIVTALVITYDEQHDDRFEVFTDVDPNEFLVRMARVKSDWAEFSPDALKRLADRPDKTMGGWEGRTIYFIKGGNHPKYWTPEKADEDLLLLLSSGFRAWPEMILDRVTHVRERIAPGQEHFRAYKDHVRIVVNYLFVDFLGEAVPQLRTEVEHEGLEIRDLLCQNKADSGFWKDLKEKYGCTEILFEAKNAQQVTRDNLRQTYCYLKPAIGLWGFVTCRSGQPRTIFAYNRTLFNNFAQQRGVLILTDDHLRRMVEMKIRGRDPSDYLRDLMSDFTRSM